MRRVLTEPLPVVAAFRQAGRPGRGAGKKRCPLWDRILGVWNQWVGGAHLLFVHRFIPAAVAPATPSPAPMARIIRGRKGDGERRAGLAGKLGQCAGP